MFDYLIKNGFIVNGKKEKAFPGAIGVKNGKIAEVFHTPEPEREVSAEKILDAAGSYVTPGFIDIHRHGDWEALRNGDDELLNRQGLTTVVNGNCGLSVAPAGRKYQEEITAFLSSVTGNPPRDVAAAPPVSDMKEYMEALRRVKRSVNTGMLVGNGTIRAGVKGYETGKLSRTELREVWKAMEEALEAGALGVSLGIAYAPEFEYDRDGLVEALQPLKNGNTPITVHVRNEGDGILPSMKEIISVGKALNIPVHISHLKCIGKKNWGETPREILRLFDEAASQGVKVDFDLYPYLTGSTQLVHVLPPQCQQGGTQAILEHLADPDYRRYLTEILQKPSREFENIVELAGFERIYASTLHTKEYGSYAGQSIAEIAGRLGRDPYETLYDILLAEKCRVTMLDTIASEEDMLFFLSDERANLISDAIYPAGGKYHPRVCGAFPKLLTDYVRDKRIFSIEDAVYKMTAKPARVLGIKRGTLEAGMPADINVFHLEKLAVPADFEHPDRLSTGFDYVLVNGQIVVEKDVWRNTGCGQVVTEGSEI